MHMLFRIPAIFTSLALAACGAPGAVSSQAPATGLADTAWTLLAYRTGVAGAKDIVPAQPDQYRLHFQPDGRLAARIDCNRGSGTWKVTSSNANGGSLQVGAVALTRMMCPPDRIGNLLPQHIESVQTYRIVEGRLYLELGAGNGQSVWARSVVHAD